MLPAEWKDPVMMWRLLKNSSKTRPKKSARSGWNDNEKLDEFWDKKSCMGFPTTKRALFLFDKARVKIEAEKKLTIDLR